MKNILRASVFLCVILSFSCQRQQHYPDALSPQEALQRFQLQEGFEIEVFAAEPHVMDPVEMIFDPEGNIFVVEMPDYPFRPEEGKGGGRIKMLMDTDHDGVIDQSSIFAEGLSEATSIMPWKDGLLVTAAPDILYLQDTDGDHQADSRQVLFTGFFANNSEAQITNLRFSVDNWVYAANHGQAGEVTFSRKPDAAPLSMSGGDFRFRLDRDTFELASGPAQFGQTINDWGHRFISQNTIHIRHTVMPKRYMLRHGHLPSSTVSINISDHDLRMFQDTPPPYWRAERTRRRQKQYAEQGLDRVEYAEDHFTGASGATVYAADAFPEEFYGNIFTGDVAGNLIHRDVLLPAAESPTYTAVRHESEKEREFLSSTDPWFRPANFTVGPDGYLYVIDMYRQHIETPLSIPEDLKEDMDFLNGMDKGRIYRIKPVGTPSKSKLIPNLNKMESGEVAELMAHPNQWWRLQAQRLLLERQDLSVVDEVEQMFRQHQDARVRLHALYVLEGLNALGEEHVALALEDTHPGLREHGLILAERFPGFLEPIMESTGDTHPRVAFQAVLSLGEFSDQAGVPAVMADVLMRNGADPWFRTAVLSAEAGSSGKLMELLKARGFFEGAEDWKTEFAEDISYIIAARDQPKEVSAYLDWLDTMPPTWQRAATAGILSAAKKNENIALQALVKELENLTAQEETLQRLGAFYAGNDGI